MLSALTTLLKLYSKYVEKPRLNQYYNAHILPIFDYGCMIWGQCTAANSNRLVKRQKHADKIFLQADFSTPSQSMFKEFKWLDFLNRVIHHTCIMVYKALNGLAPEHIADLFKKTSEIHSRNLRSVDNELLTKISAF